LNDQKEREIQRSVRANGRVINNNEFNVNLPPALEPKSGSKVFNNKPARQIINNLEI
jgi:hypothetical protein